VSNNRYQSPAEARLHFSVGFQILHIGHGGPKRNNLYKPTSVTQAP